MACLSWPLARRLQMRQTDVLAYCLFAPAIESAAPQKGGAFVISWGCVVWRRIVVGAQARFQGDPDIQFFLRRKHACLQQGKNSTRVFANKFGDGADAAQAVRGKIVRLVGHDELLHKGAPPFLAASRVHSPAGRATGSLD